MPFSVGSSVILTTHFMEEADALCQRLGVMVNGRLCCLASSQQLKSTYGAGYHLEVSTRAKDEHGMAQLRSFLEGLAVGDGAESAVVSEHTTQ